MVQKKWYVQKIPRGGWLGFGTALIWIDPNYFGSLCSNPNKIQTNDMVGGVIHFCLMLKLFFSYWYLSFFLHYKFFANMLKKGNLMSYVAERRRRKSVSEQWTLLAQIILRAKWSLIFIRIYWFCDDLTPQSMWSAKEVNGGLFIQTKGTIAWVQILKTNSKWHHIESWHKS